MCLILRCIFKSPQVFLFTKFDIYVHRSNNGKIQSLFVCVYEGKIYPSASVVSWRNGVSEFAAGMKASLMILPRDAFGNNISSESESDQGLNSYNFTFSISTFNGSVATILNFTNKGWGDISGYLVAEFIVATAGTLLLNIKGDNQTLSGSPLIFIVNPGDSCKHKDDDIIIILYSFIKRMLTH